MVSKKDYGKVVVMGRKTLESLPGGTATGKTYQYYFVKRSKISKKKCELRFLVFRRLWRLLKQYSSEDIYVIGGESIYRQFLPCADTIHVTKIMYQYEADTFFPNLDQMDSGKMIEESEEQTYFDLEYLFSEICAKIAPKRQLPNRQHSLSPASGSQMIPSCVYPEITDIKRCYKNMT